MVSGEKWRGLSGKSGGDCLFLCCWIWVLGGWCVRGAVRYLLMAAGGQWVGYTVPGWQPLGTSWEQPGGDRAGIVGIVGLQWWRVLPKFPR